MGQITLPRKQAAKQEYRIKPLELSLEITRLLEEKEVHAKNPQKNPAA